jgi:HEPN domain-containing protein
MRFASDEQRRAVMAKIKTGRTNPRWMMRMPIGKASPKDRKPIRMKTPQDWVESAAYNHKLAGIAARDRQYRHGWENAWKAAEKCMKAASPTFRREHRLVRPLAALRTRYPEITDKMMATARWMEQKGYSAGYPNGGWVGPEDVQRAIAFSGSVLGIIGKDPRRGLPP